MNKETGLSVPDSEMLIRLSKVLETSTSILLGEVISDSKEGELKVISEKLELINLQLLQRKNARRRWIHRILIILSIMIATIGIFFILCNSPYLNWNYKDPETAVLGVTFHSFEWLFVRVAPIILVVLIIGIVLTQKKI